MVVPFDSLAQNTLLHLGSHTGVHFRCNDALARWQDSDSQVSRTRSHFQYDVARLEVGLMISLDPDTSARKRIKLVTHFVNNPEYQPKILHSTFSQTTHPCATNGFVRICCPNLSVLNRWFLAPPPAAELSPFFEDPDEGLDEAGRAAVNVCDVALGMVWFLNVDKYAVLV